MLEKEGKCVVMNMLITLLIFFLWRYIKMYPFEICNIVLTSLVLFDLYELDYWSFIIHTHFNVEV